MVKNYLVAKNIGVVLTNGVYFYTEKWKGDFFASITKNPSEAFKFDNLIIEGDDAINCKLAQINEKFQHGIVDNDYHNLTNHVCPSDFKLKRLSLSYVFQEFP